MEGKPIPMTTAYDTSILQRAKALQSPIVKELCTYIDELNATIADQRTVNALLADTNADLSKENRGLRAELTAALQDAKDARHDADCCLLELNNREEV